MENNISTSQTSFSPGLLATWFYFGLIGALIELAAIFLGAQGDIDLPYETISSCGNLVYSIGLIGMLYLCSVKVKNDGLKNPSYVVLIIFMVTSALSVISNFCTIDEFDDDFSIWDTIIIIDFVMMIVAAVSFIRNKDARMIGIWILIAAVCSFIVYFTVDGNMSKGFAKLMGFIYLIPVYCLFNSFKKYLGSNSNKEA